MRLARLLLYLLTSPLAMTAFPIAASDTSLSMVSEPGDIAGAGRTYRYDQRTATFSSGPMTWGVEVMVRTEDPSDYWNLVFSGPSYNRLTVGHYVCTSLTFPSPFVSVSGQHRGCGDASGFFDIRQIEYDSRGYVAKLWVTFEQHCEHFPAALRGELRFNADIPDTPVPALSSSGLVLLAVLILAAGLVMLTRLGA